MELEYKVRYGRKDGSFHFHDWDNEKGARKFFEGLKNDGCTVWAELCFASVDDEAPDEVIVVDEFERKTFVILGQTIIV